MDDAQLRDIALSKAIMAPDDHDPISVVERAETYLKFLKGETPSTGQGAIRKESH